MAYQAKRKQLYTEDFELTEEDGTVVHTLHVSIDADSMVSSLSKKHLELIRALDDIQNMKKDENSAKKLEVLGRTVTDLLEAVFGEENAGIILEFYNRRYIELCREVLPFVTAVVIPQVRKIAAENKKTIVAGYKKKLPLFGRK